MKNAGVILLSGKQYLVHENDELVVDKLSLEAGKTMEVPVLLTFDDEGKTMDLGSPTLTKKGKVEVVAHMKGDKIHVSKFKSKVRYRKTIGFRPQLTKVKVVSI